MIYFLLVNWALIGLWLTLDKMEDYKTNYPEKLVGIIAITFFGSIIFFVLMVLEVLHFFTRSWK